MDDVRGRIIGDCVRLQSFAEDLDKALAEGDERGLLRLYEGRSQNRVLKQINGLIDDLGMCRTVDDLPGRCEEVVRLRDVSLGVFRKISERVGNPLGLTLNFRAGAAEFFRGLISRDPSLLARVRRRREREMVRSLLTCAMKATPFILRGNANVGSLFPGLSASLGLTSAFKRLDSCRGKRRHVQDGEWMRIERETVLRMANNAKYNSAKKLPHEIARAVWRMNMPDFSAAAELPPDGRGYKDDKSLRAHFYPLRNKFIRQRDAGLSFAE